MQKFSNALAVNCAIRLLHTSSSINFPHLSLHKVSNILTSQDLQLSFILEKVMLINNYSINASGVLGSVQRGCWEPRGV